MTSSMKSELKAQVAKEAAQDPRSPVTADDAQRVILEEARKAGAVAYHFDPNSTTAEKRAQVIAQTDPQFKTVPKGVEVSTDMGGGDAKRYDLPPPSPALSAMAASKNADTNGAPSGPEDTEDWSKYGWKPRFGDGRTEGDKEAEESSTLIDHQTYLATVLDEKFFGDWYHNTAVIIFACLFSWLVALLGGGLGWLIIIMGVCSTYYRTSIRRVRRNVRDDIARELAKKGLEDATGESLEWMNNFMVKFWPIYQPILGKSIAASVNAILGASTPPFLDSMNMETFVLGTKPPRMELVKSYPREGDDIVLMDWQVSFTPTDTMDMTARQLKYMINPKVVLEIRLGKALVGKTMKIIVEDFFFKGLMRFKVKLQLQYPFVEKIEMCFLNPPEIDFACNPLGGDITDKLGFDINFIPGLKNFIMSQIHATLQPMFYAPNVFPIEVAKMLAGSPMDLAIGVVAVTIYSAQGLKNPDKFSGTPDPYVVVSLNNTKELARTKTIHENASPQWNETHYVIVANKLDLLTFQVFDYNDVRKDKELGMSSFALSKLDESDEYENIQLEVTANGKQRGLLTMDIRFFPVLGGEKLPDGTVGPTPESNTGIARITLEQAKDLDSKGMGGVLNPYGILLVNDKDIHHTAKTQKKTNNPIFDKPTTSILITDRSTARIGLILRDDRELMNDPVIGKYQMTLNDLITSLDKGNEWFNLHGTKSGMIKLQLDWRPVALRGIVGGSGGYVTPIGVMRIHMQSARDLRNLETIGKSDPYAKVLLSGIPKGRTVTFKNELNPVWDEVIYIPMHSAGEKITIEVMDEEKLGKDRTLGQVDLTATDFIKQNEDGTYEVCESRQVRSSGLLLGGRGLPKGVINYTMSFYPTMNVIDPDEELEEKEDEFHEANAETEGSPRSLAPITTTSTKTSQLNIKPLQENGRVSIGSRPSLEQHGRPATPSARSTSIAGSIMSVKKPQPPKVRLAVEDLQKYQSGLIIFNIIEGQFAHSNLRIEILMDDHAFPSYISSKARTRTHQFGEIGDSFVRELDVSRITLRLTQKADESGRKGEDDHIISKLAGQTLTTLQQCLYQPAELTLRGTDGAVSKLKVKLRYLPVDMHLDPSESINNMGTLRVDVMDASELPAADRNGFSDPYCKFKLNGKEVFKTKIQKKTLHPAWNEYFEVAIGSRTGADLVCDVMDWDFGEKADFLGATKIDLKDLEPFIAKEVHYPLNGKSGVLRVKLLFKPDYVTRARQGSSTFHGSFAPAGKVVGAPVKGVSKVGTGVMRGASLLKRPFGSKGTKEEMAEANGAADGELRPPTPSETPSRTSTLQDNTVVTAPTTPVVSLQRSSSVHSSNPITPGATPSPTGTATFIVIMATGYPPGTDIRVYFKQVGAKGGKEVYKTRTVKNHTGTVTFDTDSEHFKVPCAADTRFQVSVKDHDTFRTKDLGDGMFFVSDQGSGSEQTVKAGHGSVILRTSFVPNLTTATVDGRPDTGTGRESPSSRDAPHRRSFFSRRDG